MLFQLDSFIEAYRTASLAATGAAGIPAPTWPFGVFAPDETKHAGNADDEQFFEVKLCEAGVDVDPADAFSYHDALYEWVVNDTEVVAVEDPGAFAGEYCNVDDPTCSCH